MCTKIAITLKGILQNIPHSVNRRLSLHSSNKEVFESAIPPFQEALKKSGYDYTLNFEPPSKNMKATLKPVQQRS